MSDDSRPDWASVQPGDTVLAARGHTYFPKVPAGLNELCIVDVRPGLVKADLWGWLRHDDAGELVEIIRHPAPEPAPESSERVTRWMFSFLGVIVGVAVAMLAGLLS